MTNHRVASRYAKSILELSLEKGLLEEVYADFKKLISFSEENREFGLILKNPIVSSDKKLTVLQALFAKDTQEMTVKFFEIVARKNRADVLIEVAKAFQELYNLHQSIQVAELTTTYPVESAQKAVFENLVKEISGKKTVQFIEKVNPELIGGFVLKVNDRLLDESLKSKLNALKIEFSQNHYESKI
ncbi:ATP synthase F1 subunit delta [Algoriphagus sp.]|uniref:ATP synthase F1 subunit delta n=1 Tax=Algoriphagus sp. TaxID=1872435 RepID=UPI0026381813|nr:ATP synthase F1 subunit delta [Algoriphagus sp.]